MFKSLDELIRFKRSRLDVAWETLVRWAAGMVLAGAGFQAVCSMIFDLE